MTKKLLPFAAAVAAIVGVFAVLAVAGAFDDDDGGTRQTPNDGDGAESEDNSGGDALGACIVEDDPNYDPDQPCNDMVVDGDGEDLPLHDGDEPVSNDGGTSLNICIEGVVTCNDTVVDGSDADAIGGGEEGRAVAIEASYAALAEMGGPSDAKLASAHAVEWGNACLGIDDPGVACAQVITPGWIIVLDTGVLAYEFHTDLNGNAVLAAPAQ
ncbi:MAG TPA: hypothetical protein VMR52_09900 [Dehalococcoidia bacterium]|nr:hypothetical protein [Dehalococcoidia bacterium]